MEPDADVSLGYGQRVAGCRVAVLRGRGGVAVIRGRLRWKRDARETGLRAVGAAPRGWRLHDGVDEYAVVSPNGGNWSRKQNGWYWVAYSPLPHCNTCNAPVADPEDAKAAAMLYVKQHLAAATGQTP